MMMQWLVNEWKAFQEQINQRVEGLAKMNQDSGLAERITKCEGEIKAMKARAGKQQK